MTNNYSLSFDFQNIFSNKGFKINTSQPLVNEISNKIETSNIVDYEVQPYCGLNKFNNIEQAYYIFNQFNQFGNHSLNNVSNTEENQFITNNYDNKNDVSFENTSKSSIEKANTSKSYIFKLYCNKKRGREKKKEKISDCFHDKHAEDNLQRKVQTHFLNFLVNISNDALKAESGLERNNINSFVKIDHKIIKNVSEKFFKKLKSSSIKEILEFPISPKYKRYDPENNKTIINKIYKESKSKTKWLYNFLNMGYLNLFIHYISIKKSLKQFTFDNKEIICSKDTKPFYNLLEKYENDRDELIDLVKKVYFNKNGLGEFNEGNKSSFIYFKKDCN